MRKPFRLLIAVPCMEYLHVDFVQSLRKLEHHLIREGIAFHTEVRAGSLIYFARNQMACKAINEDYTHILFIDSDMVFDENIVETLAFCGRDFVCGAFQSRRPPYGSCIYQSLDTVINIEAEGLEPFRVAGCGMACTMISTQILKEVQEKYGTTFNPDRINGINYGEDLAFCRRATEIGTEIWCDPTARVGHIAHIPVWPGEVPKI